MWRQTCRKRLEQLCRYITRPALSHERVQLNAAGQVVLKLKTSWRDGTTHLLLSPLEFMQRLAALIPRPLAGRVGPVARPLARHKQSTGLFVSGLGGCT